MDGPEGTTLRIGAWRVHEISGRISRDGESVRVDGRSMRLLLCLAERAGKVVSTDELLKEVWSGVIVTPDSVYQAVASVRRLLGDDPKNPTYIATVPRLGYRMVATVGPWVDPASEPQAPVPERPAMTQSPLELPGASAIPEAVDMVWPGPRRGVSPLLAICTAVCLALLAAFLVSSRIPKPARADSAVLIGPPHRSVAVLPFLDLTTESMDQEYFADGLTEELIDELSKIPDLKVPSATAAFYFKGKQKTIANIARELGVAYVVDGSLRKSASTLRVAARLVRADSGFVVWSETYDRQSNDVLKVQDDVAREIKSALEVSIDRLAPSS
jgi:transcriptional activator of cad operon